MLIGGEWGQSLKVAPSFIGRTVTDQLLCATPSPLSGAADPPLTRMDE